MRSIRLLSLLGLCLILLNCSEEKKAAADDSFMESYEADLNEEDIYYLENEWEPPVSQYSSYSVWEEDDDEEEESYYGSKYISTEPSNYHVSSTTGGYVHGYSDRYGNTSAWDSNGNYYHGHTDESGYSYGWDSNGNYYHGYSDSNGNVTVMSY